MMARPLAVLAIAFIASTVGISTRTAPAVDVVAVPNGGIQPQSAVDAAGTIHLLYFAGEPGHGDLFYTRRNKSDTAFTTPIRVNSDQGSAIATGSVRGGRIALGRNGWIHVAWNGSSAVDRLGVKENPMWYTRILPGGAVEPQRAISLHTRHLDGGGDVAADRNGNVMVVWHAAGETDGETSRRIYVAASKDDGRTFTPEKSFSTTGGNCGCCQLTALVDAHGRLQLLYRSAGGGVHRDATWLTIDAGKPSREVTLQPWELPACPMTTFAMSESSGKLLAAWETAQQIFTAELDPVARTVSAPSAIGGSAIRRHPTIAINAAGDRLLAWTEGTAWARGGTLAWELRDKTGRRLAGDASAGPVPVWGLVSAVVLPAGSFIILR